MAGNLKDSLKKYLERRTGIYKKGERISDNEDA
jgi:hypothetical protein